ncbi:MAG TPA: MBL fold metallo-hydrolase [Verrucomicrobiae bacterium]|nr:MBL fold metallo-hydrolase [Verrucomicrobiae bacterium]
MKRFFMSLLVLLLVLIGALAWQFMPSPLPVPNDLVVQVPPANPPPELKVSVLFTGQILSKAGLAYRGGSLSEERSSQMAPILVEHPRGTLMIDAGFGRNVDAHMAAAQFLVRALSKYEKGVPAAEQLKSSGYDFGKLKGIVLTHAHWDHSSGAEDLPEVPLWVPQAEMDFIRECGHQAALTCGFGERPYQVYAFEGGPYLGFDSHHDVWGDGSVVMVPAPGHTPGSVIVFVTLAGGQRYAFVGDLAWAKEGIDIPAERPLLGRMAVAEDAAQVRRALVHMHQLQRALPNLLVVPAHDLRVLTKLPRYGNAS